MNWLQVASQREDRYKILEQGEEDLEPVFPTFSWDYNTRTSKNELKSQSDILQIKEDPSLILVGIPTEYVTEVGITRERLNLILDHFEIDRRALLLLQCSFRGLYQTPTAVCSTRYLATSNQNILWTDDPSHHRARGIIFHFAQKIPEDSMFSQTTSVLDLELKSSSSSSFPSHISTLINWAGLVAATAEANHKLDLGYTQVSKVEQMTGHTAVVGNTYNPKVFEDLPEASKTTSTTLVGLGRGLENLGIYISMVDEIIRSLGGDGQSGAAGCDHGGRGRERRRKEAYYPSRPIIEGQIHPDEYQLKIFIESFELIGKILTGINSEMKWLMHRTETQMTLINSLISQQDATTSIKLTKSSTEQADASNHIAAESKILAEQARQDAASMKTIAIMTMAFLPGTYIAALFAMPSLAPDPGQNSQKRILSDFGLYWAVSLPVTAAILIVWYLLNRTEEQKKKEGKIKRWARGKITSNVSLSTTVGAADEEEGEGHSGEEGTSGTGSLRPGSLRPGSLRPGSLRPGPLESGSLRSGSTGTVSLTSGFFRSSFRNSVASTKS